MKKWKLVVTQGLFSGSLASIFSTAMLALAGRREAGSAAAPINAISHWYWGDKALGLQKPDLRHTAVGYLTHHSAAMCWATLYAALASGKPALRTAPGVLSGAAATSAVAYWVDFQLTPHRFAPGYEHRISKGALLAVYAGLAAGLAAGALAFRSHYRDGAHHHDNRRPEAPGPRIVRRVRAGRMQPGTGRRDFVDARQKSL